MYIKQDGRKKALARSLRRGMTPQEMLLWNVCLKHCPVHVYRQYVIEGYIADFFCRKADLVMEVDGSQHASMEGMEYDRRRSARIGKYGILVLRFSNLDIERNLQNVARFIYGVIEERVRERSRQK